MKPYVSVLIKEVYKLYKMICHHQFFVLIFSTLKLVQSQNNNPFFNPNLQYYQYQNQHGTQQMQTSARPQMAATTTVPQVPICQMNIDQGMYCSMNPNVRNRYTSRRYGYNRNNGQCVPFLYYGCQGNGNNFISLQQCYQFCISTTSTMPAATTTATINPCQIPINYGYSCNRFNKNYYVMYGYDSNKQQCVNFPYYGCGGNMNRFQSLLACQRYCRTPTTTTALTTTTTMTTTTTTATRRTTQTTTTSTTTTTQRQIESTEFPFPDVIGRRTTRILDTFGNEDNSGETIVDNTRHYAAGGGNEGNELIDYEIAKDSKSSTLSERCLQELRPSDACNVVVKDKNMHTFDYQLGMCIPVEEYR